MDAEDNAPQKGPVELEALAEERARLERILTRLDETEDRVERADLAQELFRAGSRYEDVIERTVLPADALDVPARVTLYAEREETRDAMTIIRDRTLHIDPANVYVSDPTGFEEALTRLRRGLRAILEQEDALIGDAIAALSAEQRSELTQRVADAVRNASDRPHPPKTAVGRFIENAYDRLDNSFEDASTPHHPGKDVVEE